MLSSLTIPLDSLHQIRRPFAFINSRIYVHSTPALSHSFDSDSEAMRSGARTDEEAGYDRTLVGEAQQ